MPTRLPIPDRSQQSPIPAPAEITDLQLAGPEITAADGPTADANTAAAAIAGTLPTDDSLAWWAQEASQPLLNPSSCVSFDLATILVDALHHSPRIQIVSSQASMAIERIVQQDAAFDPRFLLDSRYGLTNDPVGNSLITGGPPRLRERSMGLTGGWQQAGRTGRVIDLSQELGLLDSNSSFFTPRDQGNTRLSLSLTQPLLAGRGRVYNERLLTQARIDSSISWQEMRGEVESRLAEIIAGYWRLYERRCHLIQEADLLQRGRRIEAIVKGRASLDAGRIERAKTRQRVARRYDQSVQLSSDVQQQQARLKALVGSEALAADEHLELIPQAAPFFPEMPMNLRDALLRGVEHRPEVRGAAAELEAAGLAIQVTRNELLPQLNAVVDTYLAGLSGRNGVLRSFGNQFYESGPGVSAALQYSLPYGRRAARSRHREALHRYRQKTEELREAIQQTRLEIESALVRAQAAAQLRQSKRRTLLAAIDEEQIVTRRWEMLGGDGARVGTVLEDLLETQQRRTEAERGWVTAQTEYVIALVDLQLAMGTLLIDEGIRPMRAKGGSDIHFDAFATAGPSHSEASLDSTEAWPAATEAWSHGTDQPSACDLGPPLLLDSRSSPTNPPAESMPAEIIPEGIMPAEITGESP